MTEFTFDSALEAAAIEQTLRDWYSAIHQQDFQTVAALLTENFIIVEHAEILTKAQQMARFEAFKDTGTQTAEQHIISTRIHGDVAWTTLRNNEVWLPADGSPAMDFEFIETIILLKQQGKWLIERYHATSTQPLPEFDDELT